MMNNEYCTILRLTEKQLDQLDVLSNESHSAHTLLIKMIGRYELINHFPCAVVTSEQIKKWTNTSSRESVRLMSRVLEKLGFAKFELDKPNGRWIVKLEFLNLKNKQFN